MSSNGGSWVWMVAVMPGLGDLAMEVPAGLLQGSRLPPEFTARRVTRFAVGAPDEHGEQPVAMQRPLLVQIGAMPVEVRMLSRRIAYFAPATADCAGRLTAYWSPPVLVAPAAKLVRGPGAS